MACEIKSLKTKNFNEERKGERQMKIKDLDDVQLSVVLSAIADACVEIFATRQTLKELVGEEVANDILGAIFATYDDTSKLCESEVE